MVNFTPKLVRRVTSMSQIVCVSPSGDIHVNSNNKLYCSFSSSLIFCCRITNHSFIFTIYKYVLRSSDYSNSSFFACVAFLIYGNYSFYDYILEKNSLDSLSQYYLILRQ